MDEVIGELEAGIKQLELVEHLVPIKKDDDIALEPKTDFGTRVLTELMARAQFPPCPEGDCAFEGDSCKWCGKIKR